MRSWALSCVTNWKSLELVLYFVVNIGRDPVVGIQCTSYSKKTSHTCSLNSFSELDFGLMGVMRTGVWWTKCKKCNAIRRETVEPSVKCNYYFNIFFFFSLFFSSQILSLDFFINYEKMPRKATAKGKGKGKGGEVEEGKVRKWALNRLHDGVPAAAPATKGADYPFDSLFYIPHDFLTALCPLQEGRVL